MAISNTAADLLLDVMFGQAANPFPASYWIALSETDPLVDGTGLTELTGSGYARVELVNDGTTFPGASGRSTTIGVDVTYAAASGLWNTVTHFALYGHVTATTNYYGSGALVLPVAIASGASAFFSAGTLTFDVPEV